MVKMQMDGLCVIQCASFKELLDKEKTLCYSEK